MSHGLYTRRTRVALPDIGRSVPTATLHLLFLAIGTGLCLLVLTSPVVLAVGLLLAVAGTCVPHVVPSWWLLLLLGLSQLWREPSATDGVYYLLLAGVHLLHVIGGLARLVPWRGRMDVGACVRPLRRFVLVQVVVQAVAVGALVTFGAERGTVSGLSILAAAVLGVVAAVLARGVRRSEARD